MVTAVVEDVATGIAEENGDEVGGGEAMGPPVETSTSKNLVLAVEGSKNPSRSAGATAVMVVAAAPGGGGDAWRWGAFACVCGTTAPVAAASGRGGLPFCKEEAVGEVNDVP